MMAIGSDENHNSKQGQDKLIAGKIEPGATHWLVSGIELSSGSVQ